MKELNCICDMTWSHVTLEKIKMRLGSMDRRMCEGQVKALKRRTYEMVKLEQDLAPMDHETVKSK